MGENHKVNHIMVHNGITGTFAIIIVFLVVSTGIVVYLRKRKEKRDKFDNMRNSTISYNTPTNSDHNLCQTQLNKDRRTSYFSILNKDKDSVSSGGDYDNRGIPTVR